MPSRLCCTTARLRNRVASASAEEGVPLKLVQQQQTMLAGAASLGDVESPHTNARVGFDADYDNACLAFGRGGDRTIMAAWRELGDLLAGRAGWHFDIVNAGAAAPEALWSLGLFGASRLNIHVNDVGWFECFDYDEDRTDVCATIADVTAWIEDADREERARKPTDLQSEIASGDDWKIFKVHKHTVLISWSDDYYSAAILGAAHDAAFGKTLKEAIDRASEMLCGLFGAPPGIALELNLVVELDGTATNQLRQNGK